MKTAILANRVYFQDLMSWSGLGRVQKFIDSSINGRTTLLILMNDLGFPFLECSFR